ncbi:MAG TPA: MFS transporter [Thermoanaerobaculaceae bacterium]|nr:MFS transporter [Thermoanaerobaculaceae bacterium]HRS15048.1 MFS transporter [Thermoanaerobaculaceae bacterium]
MSTFPDSDFEAAPLPAAGAAAPRGAEVVPWLTLVALSAAHFAVDCCTGIWPVFKSLAQLDLVKAGLIATVGSMAANGLQVVFGTLADRGWRKHMLVGGTVLAGAITLVPYAGSYTLMFALQLATALGSAAFHPSGAGAAGEVSRSRTGVMIGIFLAGGFLGYGFSQLLFSAVYLRSSQLTPVILVAPLAAAAALAVLLPSGPGGRRERGRGRETLDTQAVALLPLFGVQVFATTAFQSLVFLLPELMASRQAPGWIANGGAHFGLVAGGCLALLPAGHSADRWGARRVLLVGNAATGVLLALLLAGSAAPVAGLALVTAYGLFNGVNTVVTVAEGNRMLPGHASAVSSLLMGVPWCIGAVGPVVAGALAEPASGGSPALALSWLGLAIPLALVSALFVRPRRDGGPSHLDARDPRC